MKKYFFVLFLASSITLTAQSGYSVSLNLGGIRSSQLSGLGPALSFEKMINENFSVSIGTGFYNNANKFDKTIPIKNNSTTANNLIVNEVDLIISNASFKYYFDQKNFSPYLMFGGKLNVQKNKYSQMFFENEKTTYYESGITLGYFSFSLGAGMLFELYNGLKMDLSFESNFSYAVPYFNYSAGVLYTL